MYITSPLPNFDKEVDVIYVELRLGPSCPKKSVGWHTSARNHVRREESGPRLRRNSILL